MKILLKGTTNEGAFSTLFHPNGLTGTYGHYIVIVGYGNDTNSGGREFIILHDPKTEKSKYVYLDLFPAQYYVQGQWIWGES